MHAERLYALGDLDRLGDLDSALEPVLHVVLHQHGGIRPRGRLHHLLETHIHEPHAVGQRTAEFVAAMIGIRRQELRDQITVPRVHLHAVETRFVGRRHGAPEVARHVGDLRTAQLAMERRGIEVETSRGRHGETSRGRPVGHIAAMADLDSRGSALTVYVVGYVLERGHDLVAKPQLAVERHAAAVDRRIGQSGHADTAAGHAYVVILQLLRGSEILAHRLESRRADGAVAQRDGTQFIRGEELGILQIFFHIFRVSSNR